MDTYNPNKLTAAPKKVDISLRQLADFDQTGGSRDRVDNVRDNQVLVSLSNINRPKTFSFKYISDLLLGGTGITITTDKDGITTISASGSGYVPYIGATGNVNLGEYELKAGQLTLDTSPTGTAAVGTTQWNDTIGSSQTTLKGGSVILKNGVDLVARVVNKVTPNTTLTKAAYQAVRISGAQGQRLAVAFAQADNDNNSADTIGLVTETIATNQEGFIMTVGNLEEINTTGSLQGETWVDGDVLYLSPTTPGALTNIKPTGATGHIVVMGYVEYSHAIHGKIYVKIMNGWELDELHNVYISSPTNNEVLTYESSTSLWKNKTVATALGYTPVPETRTLTINGTTQDLSADRTFTIATGLTVGSTAIASGTVGRVLFEGTGNVLQQSTNLFWNATNNRLGVNTSTPASALQVVGTLNATNIQSPFIFTTGSDQLILATQGGTAALTIFPTSRNVLIQSGGTAVDAGYKLDVNGTARVGSSSASGEFRIKGGAGIGQYIYLDNGGSDVWTILGANVLVIDRGATRILRANSNAQVTINGNVNDGSAQMQIESTTRGFLPPRMTTTQKNAIASPAAGLVVYDTTLGKLCVRGASAWETITSV